MGLFSSFQAPYIKGEVGKGALKILIKLSMDYLHLDMFILP
jgi:hypothetical protein